MKSTFIRICSRLLIGLSLTAYAYTQDSGVTTAFVERQAVASAPAALPLKQQRQVRKQCANSEVQFQKLDGYKNCLAEHNVAYVQSEWCPVVKAFCDAQWYPFGGKDQCFIERGCKPE